MEHIKLYVSVHLIIINNNQILLQRRYKTGFEDGKYGVVSGHIDGNEQILEAMFREAREEAGIILDLDNTRIVQVMHRKKPNEERIDYFIECTSWNGSIKIMEPNKCDDLSWFPLDNLPDNTIEYIRFAINCYVKGNHFTSFGWFKD